MGFFRSTINKLTNLFRRSTKVKLPQSLQRKLDDAKDIKEIERELAKYPANVRKEFDRIMDDALDDSAPSRPRGKTWTTSGEWQDFVSTNVARAMYDNPNEELWIEYKDGSIYMYSSISERTAKSFLNAGSKGKWVWDNLRVRGTVYGYKVPYVLVSAFGKQRRWMETEAKRQKHGSLPQTGEPNAPDWRAPER